ncbi:MAG: D-aminoacyl-tRNA deacylase [Lacunisphaera sp.]|nr:D-aminoacyl-tRNA deacylase [Lacunisphaera sp.]
MRVVIQRVSAASVTIAGRVTGQIDRGLLVFVGIEEADTAADGEWLAQKIARLRIFADAEGHMNLSLLDLAGARDAPGSAPQAPGLRALALVVSQFTLHASTQKGARPSFHRAARPAHAQPLYRQFIGQLSTALGRPVATGEFGAMMEVALVNDGPVTLVIDSQQRE